MSNQARFQLGTAFVALGAIAVPLSIWVSPDSWWVHGSWCLLALILVAPTIREAFASGFRSILKDHFLMFTLAFTVYFVFGALLPAVGPQDSVLRVFQYYPFSATDSLRVDSANAIGFGVALITGSLSSGHLFSAATLQVSKLTRRFGPRLAVMIFLGIGVPATVYVAAIDLGISGGVASGVWRMSAQLSLVAVFVAAAYRGRGQRTMLSIALIVALLESATGLLLFSKTAVLLPLAVLLAGISVRYKSRIVLIMGAVGLVSLFIGLGGLVLFGRNSVQGLLASQSEIIDARWDALNQGITLSAEDNSQTAYHPWVRFSYVGPQVAGMDLYDRGEGGEQLKLLPWLLVPRLLVPAKPIITDASQKFHTKITGRTGSSTGQGIFVTGYYNAGWLGLICVAALCGWILAQTSAISRTVLARGDTLLLPLALFGVFMAFRIDGDFLADYFGAFIFVVYALVLGVLLASGLIRRKSLA